MEYRVLEEEKIHDGFVRLSRKKVQYDTFKGHRKDTTFEVVDRGDSAAIVLYERDTNTLLFVKQFRFPATTHNNGWITEIVAGRINPGETAEHAIRREVEEEIGYQLNDIKEIGCYYLSPGACTERVFIFFGQIESTSGPNKDHYGTEGEDIQLKKVTLERARELIDSGSIIDAKTLIAVQWFLRNHSRTP